MRVAVVGHVEWVDFLLLERVPQPGEIVQAQTFWHEAAGGGADAAVQLRKLAGDATLFTALGDDGLGRRSFDELTGKGVRVETVWRVDPQRRAVCFLDSEGERTIALLGPKLIPRGSDPLPWRELEGADGVYFTGGDAEALRAARRAKVVVASARELPVLLEAGVPLDVVVASAADEGERYDGGLVPPPRFVVRTDGARGGTVEPGGRFPPGVVPGPIVDAYGAGDAFAAGLTYGLASGMAIDAALALGSRCGAAVMAGRGRYASQISL